MIWLIKNTEFKLIFCGQNSLLFDLMLYIDLQPGQAVKIGNAPV